MGYTRTDIIMCWLYDKSNDTVLEYMTTAIICYKINQRFFTWLCDGINDNMLDYLTLLRREISNLHKGEHIIGFSYIHQ